MNSRLLSLGKASVALIFAGCVQAAAPAQPVPTAHALDKSLQPVDAVNVTSTVVGEPTPNKGTSPYRLGDGSPNYEALRAHYGAPNQNIVLNPRAVDVAKTTSVGSVTVESDSLVFDTATAGWLLSGHAVGDTLYCGVTCGAKAFNRKIVSMRNEGGKVYVATKQGAIKDIMTHGWLHTSQLVTFDATEEEKQKILHDPRLGSLGNCSASGATISICYSTGDQSLDFPNPHYTKTWNEFVENFPGGSIGVTPSITLWLTFDINVEVGIGATISLTDGVSLDPIFDIEDLSVTANIQPNLVIYANYDLDKSWSDNWTLVNISGADGGPSSSPITLGPLTIDTSALIEIKAEADASAAVAANAVVTVSDKISAGIGYSTNGGVSYTLPSTTFPTPQIQVNGGGNANAHASAGLNLSLGIAINGFGLSFGGPSMSAQAGAGVALNASASNQNNTCNLHLSAEGFYAFSGQADLDLGVDGLGFNYPITFPTFNKTFQPPGWPITEAVKSEVCSNGNFDAGGPQMCVISGHEQLCPSATPQCCPTASGTNACVDEATDANNCGGCTFICSQIDGTGSTCSAGVCSCVCPTGSSAAPAGSACPGGNIAGCF